VSEGAPLIQLRFSVDERTNSLIVAGSPNDILLVEAMIHRLEETPIQDRVNDVYHLRNSSAPDLANALSTFLAKSLSVLSQGGQLSPFLEIQRDVVVIPEPITNKLLISATQRRYAEVMRLIEQLDAEPAQVVVQVLIAEVHMTNTEDFGVEFGLQAPVLFRRSVGSITTNTAIPPGATGFNFNNPSQPLPNSFASDPSIVGFQGLNSLGVGRVSPANGVGGFVLSAASDTFNLLIRALKTQNRIDILSRPQLTTTDNQVSFINIGLQVPTVTTQTLSFGTTQNGVTYVNTGVTLAVTPRISPDGSVLMRVVPEVSSVGSSIIVAGNSYPQFNIEHFETTVSVQDGETIALGGLISKSDSKTENKIPWFGDLPYIGAAFRFRSQSKDRRELLVILTPHIIRSPMDKARILAEEARRMEWCVGDVVSVHGTSGMAPILPTPPGFHSADLPGVSLDPALLPSCPTPGNTPPAPEALPSPRTGPGPQSQRPPSMGVQNAANLEPGFPTAGPWRK